MFLEGILNLALALKSFADASIKKFLCTAADSKEGERLNWVSRKERRAVE